MIKLQSAKGEISISDAVFTNITGNAFTVTFASLVGLVVTGVWNETYQRVEF